MENENNNAQHFLDLIQKSRKGKFKIYIGMSAGVGKTFRMLQEAHSLLKNGIDVKIGYIETHMRKETHELLAGLPIIPRRTIFYKGKELEEPVRFKWKQQQEKLLQSISAEERLILRDLLKRMEKNLY